MTQSNTLMRMVQGGKRAEIDTGAVVSANGVDLSPEEIAQLSDQIVSVTTTATPATGSNGVQFVFKNALGNIITGIRGLTCYVSTSAGAQTTAVSSLAVLTNGGLTTLVTGKVALVTTSAAGLLGITLTASAATYYLSFVLPNGKVITSSALVVN